MGDHRTPMANRKERRNSLLARAVAAMAAALVLVLTVLAASPELHERLHALGAAAATTSHPSGGATAADDEDGCVVTLFAQGLVLPLGLLVLAVCLRTLRLPAFGLLDRVALASPRYLRLPTQAPPSA